MRATIQQRAAVERLVEIGGTSVSMAMRTSKFPYSAKTAKNPNKLTESRGFQEICEENGLTDMFLTKALYNDIKGKPKKREKELRLAFQIKQKLTNNEPTGTTTNILNIIAPEQAERIARRILNGDAESETVPR
jgi:hypothetical protein